MSKYIIDTEAWSNLFEAQKVGIYGIGNDIATDEKTVWSRMFRLDELEELNSDYINERFGSLQDEAYERGYKDGKNIIDKGCKGCKYESRTAMEEPCKYCSNCHTNKYAPMPKEDDHIEVGDEVVFETEGAEPFVILHKYYDDAGHPSEYRYFVYAQNGEVLIFSESDGPKKTGRHFQETNKLLEAMKS